MPRLGVIEVNQLPAFTVLETISTEDILSARMSQLVTLWTAADPPNAAQYDVGTLEFDPIKINQELNTYGEMTLRDRVNQAARAVSLADATGNDIDHIASRYPGGMPRLTNESDTDYKTRIWLSPNTLTQNGVYENYVFFALTAAATNDEALRDCQALATPGTPNVDIYIMADGTPFAAILDGTTNLPTGAFGTYPSPVPTSQQITDVFQYITAPGMGRKGLTDVVSVNGPVVISATLTVDVWLFPGWDQTLSMQPLYTALAALLEDQRYLGFSLTKSAIAGALKTGGVYSVDPSVTVAGGVPTNPLNDPDVLIPLTAWQAISYTAVQVNFQGYAGIGPLPPNS